MKLYILIFIFTCFLYTQETHISIIKNNDQYEITTIKEHVFYNDNYNFQKTDIIKENSNLSDFCYFLGGEFSYYEVTVNNNTYLIKKIDNQYFELWGTNEEGEAAWIYDYNQLKQVDILTQDQINIFLKVFEPTKVTIKSNLIKNMLNLEQVEQMRKKRHYPEKNNTWSLNPGNYTLKIDSKKSFKVTKNQQTKILSPDGVFKFQVQPEDQDFTIEIVPHTELHEIKINKHYGNDNTVQTKKNLTAGSQEIVLDIRNEYIINEKLLPEDIQIAQDKNIITIEISNDRDIDVYLQRKTYLITKKTIPEVKGAKFYYVVNGENKELPQRLPAGNYKVSVSLPGNTYLTPKEKLLEVGSQNSSIQFQLNKSKSNSKTIKPQMPQQVLITADLLDYLIVLFQYPWDQNDAFIQNEMVQKIIQDRPTFKNQGEAQKNEIRKEQEFWAQKIEDSKLELMITALWSRQLEEKLSKQELEFLNNDEEIKPYRDAKNWPIKKLEEEIQEKMNKFLKNTSWKNK